MTNADLLLIERFYGAFAEGDGATMAACYAPNVRFSDPVFPDLRSPRAGAMWQMLTGAPGEVRIELLEHEAGGGKGTAHWRAHYTFSEAGRRSSARRSGRRPQASSTSTRRGRPERPLARSKWAERPGSTPPSGS